MRPSFLFALLTVSLLTCVGPSLTFAQESTTPSASAQAKDSANAKDLLKQANAKAKKRDWNAAIPLYKQAIQADPSLIKAYAGCGKALRSKKDYKGAREMYEAGRKANPSWDRALYLIGLTERRAGNFDQAIESYEAYSAKKPDDPDTYYGLGSSYQSAGRKREAIASFQAYVKREKRASEKRWVEKAKKTIATLQAELDAQPKTESPNPVATQPSKPAAAPNAEVAQLLNDADAATKLGNYDVAQPLYEKAAKLDQKGVEAYYKLGVIKALRGDLPGAITSWEIVLARDPSKKIAVRNIQSARAKLDAIAKEGIDDPAITGTSKEQHALAERYLKDAQPTMALRVLDPLLVTSPEDASIRLTRGQALMELGRFTEASHDLQTALTLRPQDANVLRAIGQNALALKDHARARYFLALYLERTDPSSKNRSLDATRALLRNLPKP